MCFTAPAICPAREPSATREIPGLFEQLDEVLQKQLDPIAETLQETEPAFYNAYRVARVIVDESATRESQEGENAEGKGSNATKAA